MNEKGVKNSIRALLDQQGIWNVCLWGGPMSKRGLPDIIACLPATGRLFAIEVKRTDWTPPGPQTTRYPHYKRQADILARIRAMGGVGIFAVSADDVQRVLEAEGYTFINSEDILND